MECCAICGTFDDVHVCDVREGEHVLRPWLCLECLFKVRGQGIDADLAPVWIERAARRQLPLKVLPAS